MFSSIKYSVDFNRLVPFIVLILKNGLLLDIDVQNFIERFNISTDNLSNIPEELDINGVPIDSQENSNGGLTLRSFVNYGQIVIGGTSFDQNSRIPNAVIIDMGVHMISIDTDEKKIIITTNDETENTTKEFTVDSNLEEMMEYIGLILEKFEEKQKNAILTLLFNSGADISGTDTFGDRGLSQNMTVMGSPDDQLADKFSQYMVRDFGSTMASISQIDENVINVTNHMNIFDRYLRQFVNDTERIANDTERIANYTQRGLQTKRRMHDEIRKLRRQQKNKTIVKKVLQYTAGSTGYVLGMLMLFIQRMFEMIRL